MAGQLDGKVTIVTGAANGIGRASALLFAREGAKVVVADIDRDSGANVAREIKSAGGEAVFVPVDLTNEAQVQQLVKTAVGTYGRLDCAYNNAGIGNKPGLVPELELADFRRVMDVNLIGTFLCLKYEIPEMVKAGGGTIVNTSSLAGVAGALWLAPYVASKHAINGLVKTAAVEYAKKNIRINVVCPGNVVTETLKAAVGDLSKLIPTAMGRPAQPEEIAEAALWLLSARSSYVTGQEICVDGGMRAATSLMPD